MQGESSSENEKTTKKSKLTRRDFLKYSAGMAAVAAGASAMLGKIPLPATESAKTPPAPFTRSDPIVVSVNGDELTVMSGHSEVKVKDASLAAEIASKIE